MKLLHKHLLAACTPYLLLIVGVWILLAWVIETTQFPFLMTKSMAMYVGDVRWNIWLAHFAIMGLVVVSMVVSAMIVWFRHRSAAARFAVLTENIQRFGAGDHSLRSSDTSSDELGKLAAAFNDMADDIVHANRKLQKQVAEHERSPNARGQHNDELQAKLIDLERFASSAAHELKAPLVTIQGFAKGLEALAKSSDWGHFHDDVHRIQQAGKDLQATVDSLLQLARTGQGANLAENVSLQKAAEEAVELLRGSIEPQRVAIVIADDLPTVKGDGVLWRHVYQNLIANALAACESAASPKIDIGCEHRDGQSVCFVRDNGKGLNSERIETLFHRQGSGLGLPLVRRIVEFHGGKIWAESQPRGTLIAWTVGD